MELVRYALTDPRSDGQWVRDDLESMIAIANQVGASRFQGFTILRDVVQFEKQGDRWVPGPLQVRSLSYEDVCGHYQRILSAYPGCGLQVASHGLVFLDDDGVTLLRAPYKADGVTIDEDELYELDGDVFYYGHWEGETPESTRADILSPTLREIPDLEEILSRNNSRSFF
ncbi:MULTISPECIES: hypothetical protein [Pseudomonas aeruginosa group]|jgi:hypothetical protein|uniref:Uncharacterized protein n=5 Tax=Pseudomonas aeruginosa TaxID=287 RepID=A0A9P1VZ88_PSEAI|nr:hypothetical protein [Pseudomonas aeruginosa]KAG0761763.1 hypothetical protein G6F24_007317 [Rhizopus arrhizus]AKG03091.1 hypothetical protein YH69_34145 [Pseudomonas aeruginosa]AXZ89116.1 hypothetical protein AM490_00445 [Pseudomonas aeruginosa]AZM87000.1 hypothetical protein EIP87_33805 [Pseudomonas aeruginosa]EIU2680139.1 hypothetical protein [Pseudomonas aeruginosa]